MVEPMESNEALNDSLKALCRTFDEMEAKKCNKKDLSWYEDYMSSSPMRDGEEIRTFLNDL